MIGIEQSADWLYWRAQATPNRCALLFGDRAWTFAELDALTDSMCDWLSQQKLPVNRRVGVLMQNRLEYVLLIYAASRMGLTLVTFNTRLSAAEVDWQVAFTKCEWVVLDEANSKRLNWVQKEAVTLAPDIDALLPLAKYREWGTDKGQSAESEAVQAIVFTSGTTGRPKAVPISYAQHFYSSMASSYRLGVEIHDIWLSVLPLYHVGGMAVVFRSLLYGTCFDLHPRFDLQEINDSLDQKSITMISVVPTMLYRLIESRQAWPNSLRLILVGGAAASPELVSAAGELAKEGNPLISTSYGMTEVASQFATQTPADTVKKPASVGRPFLLNQLRIMGDDGVPAPVGHYGEIQIKGPVVMSGYLDNQEANLERFQDGWFCTGDIGYLDQDGDLFVVQRRSDLIISGGENVYPAEVEAALRLHPAVKEACVVGVPDIEWGETVTAMVELLPGQRLDDIALISFARQHLAGYKQPRRIEFVTQLPQTASGKIERKRVVELLSGDN